MIHKRVVPSRAWAELSARSHYSLLEGSAAPADLVAAAAALGLPALGLCDRHSLRGAAEFSVAARKAGLHPIVGTEIDLVGGDRLRLLATGKDGLRALSKATEDAQQASGGHPLFDLFGEAHRPDPDFQPFHRRHRLAEPPPRADQEPASAGPTPPAGRLPTGWAGLAASAQPPQGPPAHLDPADLRGCHVLAGGRESAIAEALLAGDPRLADRHLIRLRDTFGRDNVALLLTHHRESIDTWLVAETAALARRCGVPLVASNLPVHANDGDKWLLDVYTAIRHRTTLDRAAASGLLLPNAEHRLKSEAELRELLGDHPEAFDKAAEIAARCDAAVDGE